MVLLAVHPEPSVLLIRRPDTLLHHAGQIACPGGAFDHHADRTLWDTARRETREEVGIDVPLQELAGYLDPVHIQVTGFTLSPAVVILPTRPPVSPEPREVASYHWQPLQELREVRRMGRMGSGGAHPVPEFPLSWGHLWGATARVMDQLLPLADSVGPCSRQVEG